MIDYPKFFKIQKMKQYVIYDKPKDYPNAFVLREWIINAGEVIAGDLLIIDEDIYKVREKIPDGCVMIPPFDNDDPAIFEVWI